MNKFQITYILLWFFMTIGILGNIELGVSTPLINMIIYGVVSFLTAGKMIYLYIKGVI